MLQQCWCWLLNYLLNYNLLNIYFSFSVILTWRLTPTIRWLNIRRSTQIWIFTCEEIGTSLCVQLQTKQLNYNCYQDDSWYVLWFQYFFKTMLYFQKKPIQTMKNFCGATFDLFLYTKDNNIPRFSYKRSRMLSIWTWIVLNGLKPTTWLQ